MHLSHVLLVHQVWTLSGRRRSNKKLKGQFQNWEGFASAVAKDLISCALDGHHKEPPPYVLAGADYWRALETSFEENDPEYVRWLGRIGRPH